MCYIGEAFAFVSIDSGNYHFQIDNPIKLYEKFLRFKAFCLQ